MRLSFNLYAVGVAEAVPESSDPNEHLYHPLHMNPLKMSPKVRVTVTAVLANYLGGQRDFIVEADSVRAVIEELAKKYGSEIRRRLFDEEGRLRRYINIYVNDRGLSHQEIDMRLQDGDEVLILPAVSGG